MEPLVEASPVVEVPLEEELMELPTEQPVVLLEEELLELPTEQLVAPKEEAAPMVEAPLEARGATC
jgi:hypothetical protein